MERVCSRCGKKIEEYEVAYRVYISVVQDVPLVIDERNTPDEEEIKEILETVKDLPEDTLEEEIHEEKGFLLCEQCAEIFRANPLGRMLRLPEDSQNKDENE